MNFAKRPLVAGAAALFAAGIANRLIGTVYRVFLVRAAGEEVVGIFQMTLPVYRVAFTVATAGLHVAIARLAADAFGARRGDLARRYGAVGVQLTAVTATVAALLLFFTRSLWAHHVLTEPRTLVALSLMPLLLIPAALSASLRGVLQGQEKLTPLAVSSFAEALSRVPIVLLFVSTLLPLGAAWATGGIAAGLAGGEIVSLAVLLWFIRKSGTRRSRQTARPKVPRSAGRAFFWVLDQPRVALTLLGIAVPVLFSGLLNGALGMINVALIPRQLLIAGTSAQEATLLYGRLFGMALPVLYMPMVAVHPLVHTAVPAVAKRLAAGDRAAVRRLLTQCYAVAATVSVVTSAGLAMFGEEIGRLLYGLDGLGPLIAPLAIAAPFVFLGHVASGILYGLGRTGISMVNTLLGNLLRLFLILLLVPNPSWGIVGALWAVVGDYALTAVLHLGSASFLLRRSLKP